jgi:hypothetical protein
MFQEFYARTLHAMSAFAQGIKTHRKNTHEMGLEGHSDFDVMAREAIIAQQAQIEAVTRGLNAVLKHASFVGATAVQVERAMNIREPNFGVEPEDEGGDGTTREDDQSYSKALATFQFALEAKCRVWFSNNDIHVIRLPYEPDHVVFLTRSASETAALRQWLDSNTSKVNVIGGRHDTGADFTKVYRTIVETLVGVPIPEKKVDTTRVERYFDATWASLIHDYTKVIIKPGEVRFMGRTVDDAFMFIHSDDLEKLHALQSWMRVKLKIEPGMGGGPEKSLGAYWLRVKFSDLEPTGFAPEPPPWLKLRTATARALSHVANDESDADERPRDDLIVVRRSVLHLVMSKLVTACTDEQIAESIEALIVPSTKIESAVRKNTNMTSDALNTKD